jgi:hypothetical protein
MQCYYEITEDSPIWGDIAECINARESFMRKWHAFRRSMKWRKADCGPVAREAGHCEGVEFTSFDAAGAACETLDSNTWKRTSSRRIEPRRGRSAGNALQKRLRTFGTYGIDVDRRAERHLSCGSAFGKSDGHMVLFSPSIAWSTHGAVLGLNVELARKLPDHMWLAELTGREAWRLLNPGETWGKGAEQ